MSLSSSRFAVTIIALLMLAGCTVLPVESDAAAPAQPSLIHPEQVRLEQPSSHWTITQKIFSAGNAFVGFTGPRYFNLRRPVAVAVSAGIFYIVDADREQLIRFDSITEQGEAIADLSRYAKGEIVDIYLHDNAFLLLADPQGEQVLQLNLQGKLLRTLQAPGVLRSPVGLTVDRFRNEILVADGGFDHVVVFSMQGEALATLGERGMEDGQFRSMTALVWSEEGLFVSMRPGGRIQMFDQDGQFQSRLPSPVLFPNAMAVDQQGRLYVSDLMANDIKVYERGVLINTLGGTGGGLPGKFQRITDLWVDQGVLYVVDSLNGRIQSLFIEQ